LPFAVFREALQFLGGVTTAHWIFRASLRYLPGLYCLIEDALGRLDVPAAVLWGEHDPFLPLAVRRQTCALVTKQGVCHQCVELDGFFNGKARSPLQRTDGTLADRLAILRETREGARPMAPAHAPTRG